MKRHLPLNVRSKHGKSSGILMLLSFVLALLITPALAQSQVSGKVTDETGASMPGVNIVIKGTSSGTTTDANGAYTVSAADGSTLVFSFIGYLTQEVSVDGRTAIDVSLAPSTETLGEVVVVGYGVQKKADLTGSVASVPIENLQVAPNTNIGQLLQGTVPGLNVGVANTAGGTPPIQIRGQVTIGGSQNVLIILDGIQYTGSLSSINPDDIASIDVLKDASSTAVYGAQAANGVILITTRKGRVGKRPTITFNTTFTTQTPTVGDDMVPKNREQYLEGIREAYYTQAYTAESGYTQPNPSFNVAQFVDASMRGTNNELLPNDFNWWEEGTNTGTIAETNLGISGGSERVTYLLSGGVVDQKGFIINDKFKRNTLRMNIETKPLEWWKVGLVSSGSFVNQDGAEPALASLQRASPLHVPFDASGNLIFSPTNTIEANPFVTYYVDDYERHDYYFANLYTEVDFPFLKGLSYRLNFGNNLRQDRHYYSSRFDAGQTGRAYKEDENYYDYTFDNILSYRQTFGKHEAGVTLLYGAIERNYRSTFTEGTGFSRLNLSYNDLSQATTQRANSDAWHEALLYQMARINYKYNERYLLTATLRQDGFSGFAKNYKQALFPSVALAWVLSEEEFLKNAISQVDQLKLRLGYGEIGNQTFRYRSLGQLTTATGTAGSNFYTAYVYGDGGSPAYGQRVNTLGNPDLKWERTKGLNLGLDIGLFGSRTTASLDFYNNRTYDLLYNVAIPNISGFNNIDTNLGEIKNSGFEAAVTHRFLTTGDLSWSATVNFSANRNKVVTLTGQDLNGDGKEDDLISSNLFIGKSLGTIYHYVTDGVYDLDDTRISGFPIGTMRVVDQDGDNDITPERDRVFLGRQEPAYRVSLMNNLSYKGINLTFLINSVQGGNDGFLGVNRPFANNIPQYFREDNTIRWNDFVGVDYWSPANPNGRYPRNISGSRAKVEPAMYQDRSFVRLQDISLSYNLANTLLKKLDARSISVFVSAKNLATWTKWEGWDPESTQNLDNNPNTPLEPVGIIAGGRPILRAFAVGLNVTY